MEENVKGFYALIICLNRNVHETVGNPGKNQFGKGMYVYVGSGKTIWNRE
jgi:Uri superfamily endonuclease